MPVAGTCGPLCITLVHSKLLSLNCGDASAFDALYYRYRDRVLKLAYRFTSNEADAQDVLQDTFTYFYRKFPRFELTASMTTFWAIRISHGRKPPGSSNLPSERKASSQVSAVSRASATLSSSVGIICG